MRVGNGVLKWKGIGAGPEVLVRCDVIESSEGGLPLLRA